MRLNQYLHVHVSATTAEALRQYTLASALTPSQVTERALLAYLASVDNQITDWNKSHYAQSEVYVREIYKLDPSDYQ
jgi:hypothetical protein